MLIMVLGMNELLLKEKWIKFHRRKPCQNLFASLLKRSLLQKERICSPWEQVLSFKRKVLFRRDLFYRKANRKSQKLSFVKTVENLQLYLVPVIIYHNNTKYSDIVTYYCKN